MITSLMQDIEEAQQALADKAEALRVWIARMESMALIQKQPDRALAMDSELRMALYEFLARVALLTTTTAKEAQQRALAAESAARKAAGDWDQPQEDSNDG
jgi:hypothetical protein